MSYCTSCGSPVPEGQQSCSMCYGDIDYGSDNYYRDYMEHCIEEERRREEENEIEEKDLPF